MNDALPHRFNVHHSSIDDSTVQLFDAFESFGLVGHHDMCEATVLPRHDVEHQGHRLDFAARLEQLAQIFR